MTKNRPGLCNVSVLPLTKTKISVSDIDFNFI